jgi:hypothetical protein
MDLGIKELGITFLVGAFTILGLELILYYFLGIPLTGFFQGKLGLQGKKRTSNHRNTEVRDQTMRTAVFIGLAFAVGILAEDISFKYVDSIQSPIASIPDTLLPESVIKRLDLSKESSRVQTLIHDLRGEAKPSQLRLSFRILRTVRKFRIGSRILSTVNRATQRLASAHLRSKSQIQF